jgi:hypothetical protein
MEHKNLTIHETPTDANNVLSVGTMIDTHFGWEAVIEKIDETKYKFGQGLTVKRLDDGAIFSICPSDIKVAFSF